MSTLMAAGVVIDGSRPRPSPYGLMSVAEDVSAKGAAKRGGATVVPYPSGVAEDIVFAQDPCDPGSGSDKELPDPLEIPIEFPAFEGYLGEICTAYNIGDWDAWRERANVAFAARENWMLERQLVNAHFVAATNLGQQAVDTVNILGGGAVAARTAVAYLQGALAEQGIEGVLHLTPEVVTYLGFENFRVDGQILRTAAGTPVIAGAGYSGAADPAGQTAAAAGQSWIYASGTPQFAREAQIFSAPETMAEALDRDDNTVLYRAERGMWVGWDAQLSAAVLADWSP